MSKHEGLGRASGLRFQEPDRVSRFACALVPQAPDLGSTLGSTGGSPLRSRNGMTPRTASEKSRGVSWRGVAMKPCRMVSYMPQYHDMLHCNLHHDMLHDAHRVYVSYNTLLPSESHVWNTLYVIGDYVRACILPPSRVPCSSTDPPAFPKASPARKAAEDCRHAGPRLTGSAAGQLRVPRCRQYPAHDEPIRPVVAD